MRLDKWFVQVSDNKMEDKLGRFGRSFVQVSDNKTEVNFGRLDKWFVQVSDNKQRISELKAVIEQRRVQRSMASLNDPSAVFQFDQQPDPAEESAKAQIEQVSFYVSLCFFM